MRDIVLAVVCRALFVAHSLLAIVKAQGEWSEDLYWVLLTPVGLALLEAVVTIFGRGGKEYKWLSPCVFLYLCGVLPSIWLLELKNLDIRNDNHICSSPYWGKTLAGCVSAFTSDEYVNLTSDDLKILTMNQTAMKVVCSIEFPSWVNYSEEKRRLEALTTPSYQLTSLAEEGHNSEIMEDPIFDGLGKSKQAIDEVLGTLYQIFDRKTWILVFHQSLLFILIIGRWLLPTGKGVGRDELSQLLLVFIGVGADILEFVVEMIKEESVRCDQTLIVLIMGLWSWSTVQFTMVLTASKARRPRAVGIFEDDLEIEEDDEEDGGVSSPYVLEDTKNQSRCMGFFTNMEVWGISSTLILQDGPFLAMRLYVMISRDVIHQMIVFFTIKNLLVFFLQIYRLAVIATTKPEEEEEKKQAEEALKKARANLSTLRSVAVAQERFKRASLKRQRTRTSVLSTASSSLGRKRELSLAHAPKP